MMVVLPGFLVLLIVTTITVIKACPLPLLPSKRSSIYGNCTCLEKIMNNMMAHHILCSQKGYGPGMPVFSVSSGPIAMLDLKSNFIREIPPGAFRNITSVQNINLAGQERENRKDQSFKIQSGAFQGLTNITVLTLMRNDIEDIRHIINTQTVDGLATLKKIFLNINNIKRIRSNSFPGLPNLEILNLNSNNIRTIGSAAFTGLQSLQSLYLSHNKISAILTGAFTGLTKLKNLYLNDNEISRVAHDAFVTLHSLSNLDIVENKITRLHKSAFEKKALNDIMLSTDKNPWHCNCQVVWLRTLSPTIEGECNTPKKYKQASITDFPINNCNKKPVSIDTKKCTSLSSSSCSQYNSTLQVAPTPKTEPVSQSALTITPSVLLFAVVFIANLV